MSTGAIVGIVVGVIVVAVLVGLAMRAARARRLESRRAEALEHREHGRVADARSRRAQAEAEERSARARREQALADEQAAVARREGRFARERQAHADEIDPDAGEGGDHEGADRGAAEHEQTRTTGGGRR